LEVERRRDVSPVCVALFPTRTLKETASIEQGAALTEDTGKEGTLPQDLDMDMEHPYQLPMMLLMYMHPTFETKAITNVILCLISK
jgi:hypothetical protein